MVNEAPLIGITTRGVPGSIIGEVPVGMRHMLLEGVFTEYPEAIAAVGGVPVLISRRAQVEQLVHRIDGVLLSGGEDVEPWRYGSEEGPHDTRHDPDRDSFEESLIRRAMALGKPILAICRGCQMLNVALGGTLESHLHEVDDFSHMDTRDPRDAKRHPVTLSRDSQLAEALGRQLDDDGSLLVNSFHHQAVDQPGRGLRVVGRAHDGTVEAIEGTEALVFGVQWHPEMHLGHDPIFPWFINIVREAKAAAREFTRVESA